MPDTSISQNNEQILNDIQSLQEMEQQLFSGLETNTTLTTAQRRQIIEKINQLSNMRINLYQTLSGVNNFYQNTLSSSVGTLKEQTVVIGIVESELNKSKRRLEVLEKEKNNKIRLVEINSYYSDKYAEHSQLMIILILVLVPIILLTIINRKGYLPDMIYYFLLIIISLIGSVYFWICFTSIIMRDNMNYQEYNWSFNPKNVTTANAKETTDPWLSFDVPGTCIGEYCCSTGQTWDASLNQCTGASTVEGFFTEGMVNDILTKTQPDKFKSDANIGNLREPMSNSFINNSR